MQDPTIITTLATTPDTIPDAFTGAPEKSRAEITEITTSSTLQDFADAIAHVRPGDITLRSPVTETTDDGATIRDPVWETGESDARLFELDESWVYTDELVRLDALQVVALEEGIITDPTDYPVGTAFHPAIKALRERGASVPKYDWDLPEHVPVLPSTDGWTPPESGTKTESADTDLSIEQARARCQAELQGAMRRGEPTLLVALPTMGKSYGTILAAAETGEPVTILTCRGHKEQYAQFEKWAADHDLTYRRLPNFFRECPTAPEGTPESEVARRVKSWYARGADPQLIHDRAAEILGAPLPCQQDGECPYMTAWEFDPDEYDILLGYYTHAHVPPAIMGRTVVLDEFPVDAFETTLDYRLPTAVSHFLQSYEELPFESFTGLVQHRDDRARREAALEWFDHPDESYTDAIFEDDAVHAAAPLAVYTILTADDLGNEWEHAWPVGTDDRALERIGLFDGEAGVVYLLQSPDFTCARNVIALDGTPTVAMWERSLAMELEPRHVLTEAERRSYLRDILQHEYIRTTEYTKPYNGDSVNMRQDAALLAGIEERHGVKPGLITTKNAEQRYANTGLLDLVDDYAHYGNVIGSNEFDTTRLGVVIGSNHYGDEFVKKWSAYMGVGAERDGEGRELTYGPVGDKVLRHMVEHETLQAVMRFGRDGGGATVYVHTNTLPEWVPIANEGRLIKAWSRGARQVIEVAADMESWRTAELAAHPEVEIGERQIRNVLHELADQGYVSVSREGRGYRWRNTGLGEVLDEAIDAETVPEIEPSNIYRWNFRKRE